MSAAKASSMLVLFASQTGNSEYIAKNINDEAKKRGFISKCMMMDAYTDSVHEEMTKTMENAVIVFVSSTTGDGDPPDNALKFWRFIRKLTKSNPKPFVDSVYTVLGKSLLRLGMQTWLLGYRPWGYKLLQFWCPSKKD